MVNRFQGSDLHCKISLFFLFCHSTDMVSETCLQQHWHPIYWRRLSDKVSLSMFFSFLLTEDLDSRSVIPTAKKGIQFWTHSIVSLLQPKDSISLLIWVAIKISLINLVDWSRPSARRFSDFFFLFRYFFSSIWATWLVLWPVQVERPCHLCCSLHLYYWFWHIAAISASKHLKCWENCSVDLSTIYLHYSARK